MNPYAMLALGIAWVVSMAVAGYGGYDYANGVHAQNEIKRVALRDEIRELNKEFADDVSGNVEAAIGKIRIEHKTIVNPEIRHEREIHKVLNNPDCAAPVSTVRLLNRARGFGGDSGTGTGKPQGGVPAAPETPGGKAATAGGFGTGGLRLSRGLSDLRGPGTGLD